MTAASRQQIGAIHAIAKAMRMDDGVRRSIMHDETGKVSSALLTDAEAGRVIERLKALQSSVAPASKAGGASGALPMDGPFADKLRALWISGWNLGVIAERSDRALVAFIERQTGLSHPRFLREPAEAAKAIEGLKAWLAREGGVSWPARDTDPVDLKRAVLFAQEDRLRALGDDPGPADWLHCGAAQLDRIAVKLGERIRRAQQQERTS